MAKTTTTPLDVVRFLARSWSGSLERELDLKMEGDESEKKDVQGNCRGTEASCNRNVAQWLGCNGWLNTFVRAGVTKRPEVDMIETSHAMTWMREKLGSTKSEARKEELRLHASRPCTIKVDCESVIMVLLVFGLPIPRTVI
ncbi:hypothetical protein ACLOJK_013314 [Asimina triloba]